MQEMLETLFYFDSNSMIEFKQIIGRGTRLFEESITLLFLITKMLTLSSLMRNGMVNQQILPSGRSGEQVEKKEDEEPKEKGPKKRNKNRFK